jgi:hypothetical protein
MQIEQQVPWGSPPGPISGMPIWTASTPTGLGGHGGPKKQKGKGKAGAKKQAPPAKKKK